MDVGVAVVEIFGEVVGSWLAAEEEEELAGLARNPPSSCVDAFEGLRLWLGTDNLHARIFDEPRGGLVLQEPGDSSDLAGVDNTHCQIISQG